MTGQYNAEGVKTFTASAPLAPYRRVRLNVDGELAYAGATDADCIGVTLTQAFARGDSVTVSLHCAEGTMLHVSADAFDRGEVLYAAADGKVDDAGTIPAGLALDAATAADDWIEVTRLTGGGTGTPARGSLAMDDLAPYAIPANVLVEKTAPNTVLPAVPATTNMGVVDNTYLTGAPSVETIDQRTATASAYCRFLFRVPVEYVAGETITLRVNAGMKTTVASAAATIDASCVRQAAPTVDLVATNAQNINSLVAADKDFTITPTNVVPGDILDVLLTVAIQDAATATAVIGKINSIALLLDVKG